jgi:predicted nucleic acid-binding Zn ribbon protein
VVGRFRAPMNDDHHHCKACGKVCSPNAETCSSACRDRRARTLESKRNSTYVLYGLMFLNVVLLLLFSVRI